MLTADEETVEEIVVVGSQIGAKITGALPVSVVTGLDIEATGVESGDDLWNMLLNKVKATSQKLKMLLVE